MKKNEVEKEQAIENFHWFAILRNIYIYIWVFEFDDDYMKRSEIHQHTFALLREKASVMDRRMAHVENSLGVGANFVSSDLMEM